MDIRFPNRSLRHDSIDRPPPAPPKGWRAFARLRRGVVWLEDQRWFLQAATVVFLITTVELLTSNLPLPLGLLSVVGVVLLVGFLLAALYAYVRVLQPKEVARSRSLLLIGTVLLIVLVLTRYSLVVVDALYQIYPHVPFSAMRAALPIPLGGVLLTVLFNARLAFAGSLSLTMLTGLMLAAPMSYFMFTFVGSLAGIFAMAGRQERTAFFRAGGAIGVANAYTLIAFALLNADTGTLGADVVGGLVNGLAVAVLATGLLPFLEHTFGRTTVFTLLELSNLNEPILKHLVLAAPGTYHHSIMVGTLAEAAAEAVGANALLCRVGAYYHDIGKTRHPTYFIENHAEAGSRHEKLAPSLSRAIVMSHIKEGIEIAREHGLPDVLVDMIPQHHGTRLVSFFYKRAKEAADPELQAVSEDDYRYPGPKPQTREAAILMLADAVEAATRTLSDPTPARIRGVVQKMINTIFVDAQLDECDLTLRDLHIIANSFVRILTGFFHQRIEYPETKHDEAGRKRNENGDQSHKPATDDARRDGAVKKAGPKDASRAGAPDGGL